MVSLEKYPWAKEGVRIKRAALAAVEADAIAAYGREEEACGYLSGPEDEPLLCDEQTPLVNLANKLHRLDPQKYFRTGRTYFEFDTLRFGRALTSGAASGRPIKVLYHSHLDTGAYFSPTDRAAMSMGEPPKEEGGPIVMGEGPAFPVAFLVVSVQNGKVDDHRLFVWSEEKRDFIAKDLAFVD